MPRVTSLIVRFKAGSHSAYHTLFQTFFPGQVAAARRRLGPGGLADAEDVALSAFHSLWREVADGRPLRDRLTGRDGLLRTLALLTGQKVRRARRHDRRQKRDARRTVCADSGTLADPAPPPDWRACFRETWAELTAGLTPLQLAAVELKLAGHTNADIAARVGRSERTVERQLSEVRSLWEERRT
jgi:DNA-directed RNA polymerase specialized sigma24 family protein